MYPFIRLALILTKAARAAPVPLEAPTEIRFSCLPWDLDIYGEMNNGRVLTLYDLGRFDHAIRSGFSRQTRGSGWGFAVGGASIRYRRRVRAFDRITLRTDPIGHDGRWFYMHQAMLVRGQTVSAALMRLAVTDRAGLVPVETVLARLGRTDWNPALPDWAQAWIDAEGRRPWPPDLERAPFPPQDA